MIGDYVNDLFNLILGQASRYETMTLAGPNRFVIWMDFVCSFTTHAIQSTISVVTKNYKKPTFIFSCIAFLGATYVLSPTVLAFGSSLKVDNQVKSCKRPDKYTTGFTNTANDCFANSTVQALVPLKRLNKYFAAMIEYPLPQSIVRYPMPLHLALIDTLDKLKKPVYTNTSMSIWKLLHLLETIHQGKISRAQHDAHELLLLLIDTLEDEYLKFFSFISRLDDKAKKMVTKPPQFPFSSVIESKLRCMRCKETSVPVKNPMMMLELTTPQSSNASLETIITRNNSEVIEGFSCFVCTIKHMIFTQDSLDLTPDQKSFLQYLQDRLAGRKLVINDELSEHQVYKAIIASNLSLQHENLKAIVHRQTDFVKLPKIIPIHLSRSVYEDSQSWRNACTIEFPPTLEFTSKESLGPVTYTLRSVIRHKGTHSSGHYECYRKKPQFYKTLEGYYLNDTPAIVVRNDWPSPIQSDRAVQNQEVIGRKHKKLVSVIQKPYWRISDTKVTEVSENSVLADGKAAYMLLYERL